MRILKTSNEQAGALISTMVIILVLAILIGVASTVTSTINKLTDSSRDYSQLRYEAEGALDVAYGIWLTAAGNKYGPPVASDIPARVRGPSPTNPPSFSYPYASGSGAQLQISSADEYGVPIASGTATPVPVHLNAYPGWQGLKYTYVTSVRLDGTIGGKSVNYGLRRSVEYVSVPLFQAMGFFDGDIELYKPADMTIGGLLHSNSSLYASTANSGGLRFTGNVSYSNDPRAPGVATAPFTGPGFTSVGYTETTAPPGGASWSSPGTMYAPTFPNGKANQLALVDRMEPLGTEPAKVLNTTDTNDNNDSMRELIERPNGSYTDPAAISGRRLYNKAGIIIHITGTTTASSAITTQNGVTLTSAQITTIQNAISHTPSIPSSSNGGFYDKREAKYVDVSTLDISAVKTTLEAATGFSTNGVLYIYDDTSAGTSDPKGIRLRNGYTLPTGGLTVVSDNGVYVEGDYNVGTATSSSVPSNNSGNNNGTDSNVASGYTSKASAVIADAVMILSNNWDDTHSSQSVSNRAATDTTVNTAIVSGNVPSNFVNGGTTYGYSGGFNNFPRLLESWGSADFTYYGSMVQLFQSKTFIGQWNTGDIYSPPQRWWYYDSSFLTNPPPGSLDLVTRSRGPVVRY